MVNGQNTTDTPRWIGINGISNTLSNTRTAINTVVNNAKQISQTEESWTKTDPPQFEQSLASAYSNHVGDTLPNPNPAASQNGGLNSITPLYIKNYGNYTKEDTILNAIFKEYKVKIDASITFISEAKKAAGNITDYQKEINDALSSAAQKVDTFNKTFNDIGGVFDTITNMVIFKYLI